MAYNLINWEREQGYLVPPSLREWLREGHLAWFIVDAVGQMDLGEFKFNTALAALMEYTNALSQAWEKGGIGPDAWRDAVEKLLLLLAPVAPHVTEELWERTSHAYSIHNQRLPQWDSSLAADEVITLVVQVNGKVRDRLEVPASINEEEARRLALESQKVRAHIGSGRVAQTIYVPGRLVNVVVR